MLLDDSKQDSIRLAAIQVARRKFLMCPVNLLYFVECGRSGNVQMSKEPIEWEPRKADKLAKKAVVAAKELRAIGL